MKAKYALLGISAIFLFSCADNKKSAEKKEEVQAGLNLENMNKNVRPQDDFYEFVNGEWMKKTKIPADRSRWGSFNELRKKTDVNTINVLDEAVKNQDYKKGTDQWKALSYYQSILDTATRNKEGIKPLKSYLDRISKIKDKKEVVDYMIESEPYFASNFFGVSVHSDMKNSNNNALYLYAAGNGLPERDYYVNESEDAKKIREKYLAHLERMSKFLGKSEEEAKTFAKNVLDLETKLAKAKLTKEERRKPENRYNPVTPQKVAEFIPSFTPDKYFDKLGLKTDKVILSDLNYFKKLNNIYNEASLDQVKDLLTWSLLRTNAGKLSDDISMANWEFYSKTLEGQPERRPLKERALSTVNGSIGEAVGKIYVNKMFPPEAKKKAREMVTYLQKAYVDRIKKLPWMSDETKQKAIEKVNSLTVKIGYPEKWKDYSTMQIKAPQEGGNFFNNSLAVSKWSFDRQVNKLNKPVDKTEWGMAPQIVNAYYNPLYNEIVFPAAILQPPFYDYKADEAVNYGGMGAVIGHEISHGFDDQGAKFNAKGNFENWWTKKDFESFNKLVNKLADQYSKIEVLPGVFVNGKFTSGENIGDLGGVNAALTALDLYYKDHKKPGKIQGFTPEQRFFMSWATVWRTKTRPEALKKQVKTDPHSPGQVRAVQPLKNIDAFYQAFDIKKGDKMYMDPEERVKIW